MQKQRIRTPSAGGLRTGVLFLTVSNLIVKVLGFAYKVPLNMLLGDEMASVNAATALFAVLYTATAAGIPGALALSLSRARATGDRACIRRLYSATMTLLLTVGLLLSVGVFLVAGPLGGTRTDTATRLCTVAIAPALFFSAATGVLRGFFQGFSALTPTAVSGILEAIGKTLFGVLLALLAMDVFGKSRAVAASLAVFGITLGVIMGTLFLALRYRREGRALLLSVPLSATPSPDGRAAAFSVLRLALPITATAVCMSLSGLLDAQLMRPLLTSYFGDAALAKALYSDYSTGAVTLYNLPLVLVTPIATGLVPFISGALAKGKEERARRVAGAALKLASLVSLPCALGLSALASPTLAFVFRADAEMPLHAGPSLSVLAPCVFFSSLLTVATSALQATGHERAPIFALGVGIVTKLILMPPLVRLFGTVGVPLSTLAFYLVAALIALGLLVRARMLRLPALGASLVRPLLCALPAAILARMTHTGLLSLLGAGSALPLAVLCGALVYAAMLILLRAVEREELSLLPFGAKICARIWGEEGKYE